MLTRSQIERIMDNLPDTLGDYTIHKLYGDQYKMPAEYPALIMNVITQGIRVSPSCGQIIQRYYADDDTQHKSPIEYMGEYDRAIISLKLYVAADDESTESAQEAILTLHDLTEKLMTDIRYNNNGLGFAFFDDIKLVDVDRHTPMITERDEYNRVWTYRSVTDLEIWYLYKQLVSGPELVAATISLTSDGLELPDFHSVCECSYAMDMLLYSTRVSYAMDILTTGSSNKNYTAKVILASVNNTKDYAMDIIIASD